METFSALLAICAGIHRSPVNSPHKGRWRRALMFSIICAWKNGSVSNREAGDLRRHRAHYGVTVMSTVKENQNRLISTNNISFMEPLPTTCTNTIKHKTWNKTVSKLLDTVYHCYWCRRKEPGHQQPWYWPGYRRIFRPQHPKGTFRSATKLAAQNSISMATFLW